MVQAPRYGLDGRVTEPRWGGGVIYRTRPDRPWSHPASCTNGTGFPSSGYSGRGRALITHPHLAPAVDLYLYSPSGP